MAGDGQNGALDATKGANGEAKNHVVLHFNLVDLTSDTRAAAAKPAPSTDIPLHQAQARGPNGRLLGPAGENPYQSGGGGVAPAFHLPDGSRPQDTIQPADGTPTAPGAPHAPTWNQQSVTGRKALEDIAAKNQANIKANEPGAKGAPRDPGHNSDGIAVHTTGYLERGLGIAAAVGYAQFGHPAIQRIAIPPQLRADAQKAAGDLPVVKELIQSPRKGYLEVTSPTYIAQTELSRILPIETSAKQSLAAVKIETQENIEALKLSKAARKKLEAVAAGKPTTAAGIEEAARAQRQVDYLEIADKSGRTKPAILLDETNKLNFLEKNDKFLAGGKVAEGSLNWAGMKKAMTESNLFDSKQLAPVAEIAAKEEPFVSVAGKMMSRGELEAVAKATEAGKGFFGTGWSIGKKFMTTGLVVGSETMGQAAVADALGNSGHENLGRILEPNVPGTFAKASAVLLGASMKNKGYAFLGAEVYEAESNMTHAERFGTVLAGLVPAGIALFKENKTLATTIALADVGIGLLAEATDDFAFHNDKSVTHSANAIKDVASNPSDVSKRTLQRGVDEMKDTGKENPFLLSQNYDVAHSDKMNVTTADVQGIIGAQAKYKAQMIIGQAQGETIIDNGLTQSQFLKMQDRNATIVDPPDHKEQYRIAPKERLDIGGQGVRTLIGAIGSANLLEYVTAKGGGSTSGIEDQKQSMKDELNDLLNKPHPHQIENALKESSWGFGKTVNDMSLVEFWKANNFDYSHIHDTIRNNANYYASAIPAMQEKMAAAQTALDQAKANPASSTDVAEKERLLAARTDAVGLTTLWVGKLYRDQALMKIGQIQYMLQDSHGGHTVEPQDIKPQLDLAALALQNAERYAPNNADGKQLEYMTAQMYESEKLVPPTDFRPNK